MFIILGVDRNTVKVKSACIIIFMVCKGYGKLEKVFREVIREKSGNLIMSNNPAVCIRDKSECLLCVQSDQNAIYLFLV